MPLEKGGSGSHLMLFCAVVHHPDAHGAFRRYGKGGDAGKVKFGAQTLLRVQVARKGGKLCAWLIQGSCRSWETPADVVGQNFDEV